MRELSVYRVIITNQTGETWNQYFIGRPTKVEVIEALHDVYLNKKAGINSADGGGRRMVAHRFANLQKLVEEFWEPDTNMTVVCTFVGVTVGSIKITRDSHAAVTQAAESL